MRRLSLLLLLTACDLQPAKQKKSAEPVAAVTSPPVEPPAAAPPADAVKPIKASQECIDVATHLAKLVLNSMINEDARAKAKQSEANTIKATAETCSKDKWSAEGRTCLLASKTLQDTNLCKVEPPTN